MKKLDEEAVGARGVAGGPRDAWRAAEVPRPAPTRVDQPCPRSS